MKKTITGVMTMMTLVALANPPPPPASGGREAFMKQQAFAEVSRVAGQVDVLEANQVALTERIGRLERGGGEVANLKAEIDALRSEIARLRNEMRNQRNEIVNDIVKRINAQQAAAAKAAPPPPSAAPAVPSGTYTVQPGDTLSLIAQAFGTTVGKIKDMNNLRSDNLRVGQKLKVPAKSGR